jgi:predicted glycosyltransferase
MERNLTLWFDVINPSDVWFFKPIIAALNDHRQLITLRDRAETIALADSAGIRGRAIGRHYTNRVMKYVGSPLRIAQLYWGVRGFDVGFSFEDGMAMLACKLKGIPSLFFCDNDLKFMDSNSMLQDIENRMKVNAERIIIPSACHDVFRRYADEERLVTYDGFKEDIYIADYVPDREFPQKVRTEDYVVLRPEALDSSYVGDAKSLVPELLKRLSKENVPVVYLPREKGDERLSSGFEVRVPKRPLNGLDLCNFSRAVLTGSGTLAREASCMGVPAVSFFPGRQLLSVDQEMVKKGRMIHTRDPEVIVSYVLANKGRKGRADLKKSKEVQDSLMKSIRSILEDLSGR